MREATELSWTEDYVWGQRKLGLNQSSQVGAFLLLHFLCTSSLHTKSCHFSINRSLTPYFLSTTTALASIQSFLMFSSGLLQQLQSPILSICASFFLKLEKAFTLQKTKYIEILPGLTDSWVFWSSGKGANSNSNGPWDHIFYLGPQQLLGARKWNSQGQGFSN